MGGNESGENEEGITMTLEDDPIQNSSKHPTPISGDITFQLRWRPFLTSPADLNDGPNVVLLTIFLYSCNNLMEFEDGSKIEGNNGIPEENQVVIKILGGTESQVKKSEKYTASQLRRRFYIHTIGYLGGMCCRNQHSRKFIWWIIWHTYIAGVSIG